jgi:hypothetical protein
LRERKTGRKEDEKEGRKTRRKEGRKTGRKEGRKWAGEREGGKGLGSPSLATYSFLTGTFYKCMIWYCCVHSI